MAPGGTTAVSDDALRESHPASWCDSLDPPNGLIFIQKAFIRALGAPSLVFDLGWGEGCLHGSLEETRHINIKDFRLKLSASEPGLEKGKLFSVNSKSLIL